MSKGSAQLPGEHAHAGSTCLSTCRMNRLGADLFRNGQQVPSWCGGRTTSHQTGHGSPTPSPTPPSLFATLVDSLYVMALFWTADPKLPRSSSSLSLDSHSPKTSAAIGQRHQGGCTRNGVAATIQGRRRGQPRPLQLCRSAGAWPASRNTSSSMPPQQLVPHWLGERHVRQVAGPSTPSILHSLRRLRGATE